MKTIYIFYIIKISKYLLFRFLISKLRIGSKTIVIDLTCIPDANIIEHVPRIYSRNLFAKDDQARIRGSRMTIRSKRESDHIATGKYL